MFKETKSLRSEISRRAMEGIVRRSESDCEAIGKAIIKCVGLQLASGTEEELGWHSIKGISAARYVKGDAIESDLETVKSAKAIADQAFALSASIECFQLRFPAEAGNSAEMVYEIACKFQWIALHGSVLEIDIPMSFSEFVYVQLCRNYRHFFGREPAFTYSEAKGYPGPFWDYVRAVREATGDKFTEAAIRKAHQRLREKESKKRQAKGQPYACD